MKYLKEMMERVKGLEPSTCAMATRRSSQLSYTRLGNLDCEILERVKGLEPSTCAMATRRSSQLSYTRFHIL
jgi:hypothetical protein